MAWKMFAAWDNAGFSQTLGKGKGGLNHDLRIIGEGPVADHRIAGIGQDVEDRCEINVDPDPFEFEPHESADPSQKLASPPMRHPLKDLAPGGGWRVLDERRRETRDAPPLLIDSDQQRGITERPEIAGQSPQLRGGLDVSPKEDQTGRWKISEHLLEARGDRGPVKTPDKKPRDQRFHGMTVQSLLKSYLYRCLQSETVEVNQTLLPASSCLPAPVRRGRHASATN